MELSRNHVQNVTLELGIRYRFASNRKKTEIIRKNNKSKRMRTYLFMNKSLMSPTEMLKVRR